MQPNTNGLSPESLSNLTYRQKFALAEYGYLLSPEDAEVVGKMLGNFRDRDVLPFCQANLKAIGDSTAQRALASRISQPQVPTSPFWENRQQKSLVVLALFFLGFVYLASASPRDVFATYIIFIWPAIPLMLLMFPLGFLAWLPKTFPNPSNNSLLVASLLWLPYIGVV